MEKDPGYWASFVASAICLLSGFFLFSLQYILGCIVCIGSVIAIFIYHFAPVKKSRIWPELIFIGFVGCCIAIQATFVGLFSREFAATRNKFCSLHTSCPGNNCTWTRDCRDVYMRFIVILILYAISVPALALCIYALCKRHRKLEDNIRRNRIELDRVQRSLAALVSDGAGCHPINDYPVSGQDLAVNQSVFRFGTSDAIFVKQSLMPKSPESIYTFPYPPPPPYTEVVTADSAPGSEPPPYGLY